METLDRKYMTRSIEVVRIYADTMKAALGDKLQEVIDRNRTEPRPDYAECASEKFVDPDELLIDAFERVHDRLPDLADEADSSVYDACFQAAKSADYSASMAVRSIERMAMKSGADPNGDPKIRAKKGTSKKAAVLDPIHSQGESHTPTINPWTVESLTAWSVKGNTSAWTDMYACMEIGPMTWWGKFKRLDINNAPDVVVFIPDEKIHGPADPFVLLQPDWIVRYLFTSRAQMLIVRRWVSLKGKERAKAAAGSDPMQALNAMTSNDKLRPAMNAPWKESIDGEDMAVATDAHAAILMRGLNDELLNKLQTRNSDPAPPRMSSIYCATKFRPTSIRITLADLVSASFMHQPEGEAQLVQVNGALFDPMVLRRVAISAMTFHADITFTVHEDLSIGKDPDNRRRRAIVLMSDTGSTAYLVMPRWMDGLDRRGIEGLGGIIVATFEA